MTIKEIREMYHEELDSILDKLDIHTLELGDGIVRLVTASGLWTAGFNTWDALINLKEIVRRAEARKSGMPMTEAGDDGGRAAGVGISVDADRGDGAEGLAAEEERRLLEDQMAARGGQGPGG